MMEHQEQSSKNYLFPNCYDPDSYYRLDVRTGVMRNRFGTKCCTFSSHALRGIYLGLVHETGPAAKLILRRCGEIWGERFSERFFKEINEFYKEDLSQMTMARFSALLEEYFSTAGWGRLSVDFSLMPEGIIQLEVTNAILSDTLDETEGRVDVLLEGIFQKLFSKGSGQELGCFETQSSSRGAPSSLFVLALEERMDGVEEALEGGKTHEQIIDMIRRNKLEAKA